MSPEAEKIAALVEGGAEVSQVLRDHPNLLAGLDEYIKDRDERMRQVAESDNKKEIGHSMKRRLPPP